MNMTKSANALHISQQTLSFHILKLEDCCGTALFERKPSLHLTYAGEEFLKYAQKILNDCDLLTNHMAAVSGHCMGTLKVGISAYPAKRIIPLILPKFQQRWPNVSLQLYQGSFAARVNDLLDCKLDIGIGIYTQNNPHITADFLFDDRLYLLAPRLLLKTAFQEQYDSIVQRELNGTDLAAFQSLPFMLLADSTNLGNMVANYFRKTGIKPTVAITSGSLDILETLLLHNTGLMICGKMRADDILERERRIIGFPLSDDVNDSNQISHHFKILTLNDRELPEYAVDFIELTKKAFEKLKTID